MVTKRLINSRLTNGSMTSPNNGVVPHVHTADTIKRIGTPATMSSQINKAKRVRPASHIVTRPSSMDKPSSIQTQPTDADKPLTST